MYSTHRKVYKVWAGKPEQKTPLGKPRSRYIKVDLKEIKCGILSQIIWLRTGTSGGLLRAQ
jgi:hypothetical protein